MGNNISVSDPMNGVWKFTYDLENNVVKSTDALGNSATTAYDTIGRAISYTDQLGKTTVLAYDPHSNLIGLNDANNQTTAYTYDLVDNLTFVKDGNGSGTSYSYDSMGNVTNATNANGNTTAYTYNLRGDLTSVVTPMSQTEQYKYDIAGKLAEYVKPSGTKIVYDYDKLNNLVKKEAGDETPVTYGYDSMGFRVAMKDATGDVTYSYDAVGNATKVIHHNGDTVTYEYDKFGRLAKVAYPDGDCTSYEYDLNDRLVKVTGRDNGVTTYTYDANGNVTSCTRSNNTKTNYTYNVRGDLVLLENVRTNKDNALLSSYAYEYDNKGYIVKETEKVDSYTYVRDYTYDAAGQLIAYTEDCSGSVVKYSYTYDGAGNRTGMVYYDASNTKYWTDYVYDANNELVSETYNYNKNKNKVVSEKTTYNYDVDGNLIKKTANGNNSGVWEYFYTAESRLEAVTKGGTLLMAATYDGDNNRIFQISYAGSESKVKQDSSIKSLYTSENGNSYAWEDGNGNGGNGTGHSNTGNGKKNTTTTTNKVHNHTGNNSDGTKHADCKVCSDEAKQSNQDFVQSLADDTVVVAGKELLPVGKQNSYKDYELISYINDVTIENAEVLVEYGANGTPTGTYEYGLERLSVEYVNSAKEYYLYSGTGSVVQTSEQNGSLFLRQTYDPFGNSTKIRSPLTVDIDDLNRYTYNGEDYDYNTGLQYLRARYYNTSTGSFISQDTYLGQIINPISRNRYTYAHNSPVVFDDPSGNEIVVVSGGKYGGDENAKKYQYEFIDTALLELSTIENTDEKITWLVAEADWSGDDIDYFQTMAEKYCKNNVEVIGFSSSDELVNYINYGNIKGNEDKDTRVFDPITSFSSYSHGKLYQIAYGYNLQNHFEHALSITNEFSLSIKQIKQIKSSAFSPNSKSIFYSCRTGNKIAQYWADYTQSTTFAVGGKNNSQGRTDYAYTRGNNLSDETIEEIAKQYEYYNNKRKEALNDYYVYSEFGVGKVKDIIYNLALTAYEYKFYKSLYEKVNAAEQYQNKRDCSADDVYPAFTSPIPSLEEDSYWKLFLPKS